MADQHLYDLIIVGVGPAGLSAGLYAGRAMLDTLILEGETVGGQVTTTSVVYNYPAVEKVDGTKLMNQLQKQVTDFGVQIQHDQIDAYSLKPEVKILTGKSGQEYRARSVIIATGAHPRKVGFDGEDQFRGRGVAYCSTCDGELFTGLQIFVVGGGYAAAEEADYLSRFGKHVTVLVRSDHFKCPPAMTAKLIDNPKVSIEYNTEIKSVSGDDYVSSATLVNNQTGKETIYHVDPGDNTFGIFVYVGTEPATQNLKGVLDLDSNGYIKTSVDGATNINGVFAAGDVIVKSLRQIITAAADGAQAATTAEHYVTSQKQAAGIPITPVTNNTSASSPVGQTTDLNNEESVVPHQGNWLTSDITNQLQPIFARLTSDITFEVDTNNTYLSQQLLGFINEFADLNDHFNVISKVGQGNYLPMLKILDADGRDTGLHYAGIPTGHELNSLVLGVYNVAGPGQTIDPAMVTRIKQLPAAQIRIGVSLTCHFCPDVVAACQHIAALNPQITATMIDLQHFPELRKSKKIMSVPATMINHSPVIFGSQTLEQLVTAIEKYH